MNAPAIQLPLQAMQAGFRRFSVVEYHKLIDIGILTEDDNLELLEGYLVHKMSRNPPHDAALQLLQEILPRLLPSSWRLRMQSAVTLGSSEPEPDAAIVRGDARTYVSRHPGPADIGLVIEVAEAILAADRVDKGRIYARAGIPGYWIINLVDRRVEVYSDPQASAATPSYAQRQDLGMSDDVVLTLDGANVASILVRELLP